MYYCVYFSLCKLHYEYIIDSIYIAVVTILFIGSRETYSLPYNSYGKNSTTIYLVKNFYGVDHFHNLNVTLHLHNLPLKVTFVNFRSCRRRIDAM